MGCHYAVNTKQCCCAKHKQTKRKTGKHTRRLGPSFGQHNYLKRKLQANGIFRMGPNNEWTAIAFFFVLFWERERDSYFLGWTMSIFLGHKINIQLWVLFWDQLEQKGTIWPFFVHVKIGASFCLIIVQWRTFGIEVKLIFITICMGYYFRGHFSFPRTKAVTTSTNCE